MPRHLLLKRLDPVFYAASEVRRRRVGLIAMGLALLSGLVLWAVIRGQDCPRPGTGLAWLLLSTWLVWAARRIAGRWSFDLHAMARRIEARFPDLQGRLLTSLDLPEPARGQQPGYFEERLFLETLTHSTERDWTTTVDPPSSRSWQWPVWQGLGWLLIACLGVHLQSIDSPKPRLASSPAASAVPVEVTPGDTEVEKGSKLIVEARFSGLVPEGATVELLDAVTGVPTGQSFPMSRNLDDPVFGTLVPGIDRPVRYRVQHSDGVSATYSVGVFELPRVERTDVTVTPPAYAGQTPETLRDVRKFTALEGSDLNFSISVNHPVTAAELYGEDGKSIPLLPSPENPNLLTAAVKPLSDQRYRVHLVDAADRVNAEPPWLTVKLRRNEPPKFELVFPGRDTEVSALEELTVRGKVWDDLGIAKAGATFTAGDRTETIVLTGEALPGKASHELTTLFALENYGVRPAQLVSYHLWAEDTGPNGKPRRTESDLFFAEVREWDHEFREGVQQGESAEGGKGNQAGELRQQQKEVLNATWKIAREAAARGAASQFPDLKVVREGQLRVAGNVNTVLQDVADKQTRASLEAARARMQEVAKTLAAVPKSKTPEQGIASAMAAERQAYQHLLAAEARETQVSRSLKSAFGKEGASQKRQLMQLELKEDEQRYETERKAQKEENTAQEENLEVLARLKELARRQEALAEKIQELEAALKAAKDERERDDLERRLERLREEQREMLQDVDDLLERMESEKNAERMGQEAEQLKTARERIREAGEKLERQELSSAANSARHAQEELNQVREEFRERAGQRFADELREMREEARKLGEFQEQIGQKLDQAPARATEAEADEKGAADPREIATDLAGQKEKLETFLERMKRVSEQAEPTEPILSQKLYEAVRDAQSEQPAEALEQASRLSRYGAMAEAQEQERAAARAIGRLQTGVEQAAESVLGSESEALRTARKELDEAIQGMQQPSTNPTNPSDPSKASSQAISALRKVEQILDSPALQAEAADLLDRARAWNRESRERDAAAPEWNLARMQLLEPMLELRQNVAEALARVEKDNPLVPADRDPVPGPYRELVRRYYEKLAAGTEADPAN